MVREAHNVPEVLILSLAESAGCTGEGCGCSNGHAPRVPVLACADALRGSGVSVETVTAGSDAEIDSAVKPVEAGDARLIVAAASDAEVRGVIRRMTRHAAPAPSKRPAEMAVGRTMYDLVPIAILPLTPAVPRLLTRLAAPTDPAAVAAAVVAGRTRRLDLLRTDSGSVTLHGTLIGGVTASGSAGAWRGSVEVDDAILTDGGEPLIACAIGNVGQSDVDGLPLVRDAAPDDGLVDVAIAVPVLRRRLLRTATVSFEVRRARGRAVGVTPRDDSVPFIDDGVVANLTKKRSWWIERGAWALYVT